MNTPEDLSQSLVALLRGLYGHIGSTRRKQFVLLLGLTLVSSLAEVVSLGAVLPFVGIITQPDTVFNHPLMARPIAVLGFTSGAELVLPLTIGFALAALAAGGLRLLLLWVSVRLGNATGADLSIEVYRRTLYQPYRVHVSRSSSEIISGITQKVGTATSVLVSGVAVITSAILFLAILFTLVALDPVVATVAAASFGIAYGSVAVFTKARLIRNGEFMADSQTQAVKSIQEGLGAIRDVLLDGTQEVYCEVYGKAVFKLQRAYGENTFINQAPRFAMEALGMALIAMFVLVLNSQSGGVTAALPMLAMLALGAQRLLPLMQQFYGNWSVVTGSRAALRDVLDLLDQPLPPEMLGPKPQPLDLNDSIVIRNLSFRYGMQEPWVLSDINLTIPKGARIGFVGSTGSGKSTALDLVMGLLEPTRGSVLVDGHPIDEQNRRAWQCNVAHVPQSIFLTDASIAENIAFGVRYEDIDFERVRDSAERASIAEFVESRPEGYATLVGERGVRLSGGQRQRIGIARAIYKQAAVIVFDEATSALDNRTERAVMDAIENLGDDLTLLIIAHRLTTLKACTEIVELNLGAIQRIGSYAELVDSLS